MIYKEKEILLRDGYRCLFRAPEENDAEEMLSYLKTCAEETNFLLRYPEEVTETIAEESAFLKSVADSRYNIMIAAIINGEIAGICQLSINKRMKTSHRGTVAIGLKKKYWGIGIGTAMFQELISIAKSNGVSQLELEVIEGNTRAIALYKKMGFFNYGERKKSIKLKDESFLSEFLMMKYL